MASLSNCPFMAIIQILLNLFIMVTANAKWFASMKFDPPYIHDLIVGKNRTVELLIDMNTEYEHYSHHNAWKVNIK